MTEAQDQNQSGEGAAPHPRDQMEHHDPVEPISTTRRGQPGGWHHPENWNPTQPPPGSGSGSPASPPIPQPPQMFRMEDLHLLSRVASLEGKVEGILLGVAGRLQDLERRVASLEAHAMIAGTSPPELMNTGGPRGDNRPTEQPRQSERIIWSRQPERESLGSERPESAEHRKPEKGDGG